MITITQNSSCLIGKPEEIEALSKKEKAFILLISDSHRNYEKFLKTVTKYGPTSDAMICAGDTANDVLFLLEQAVEDSKLRNLIPPVLSFVQGNGDPSSYPVDFLPGNRLHIPSRQILEACGKKIYVSHGHLHGVDFGDDLIINEAKLDNCQIIVHGHTHIKREERIDGIYVVNPGSLSRPRDDSWGSCAVMTLMPNVMDISFLKV